MSGIQPHSTLVKSGNWIIFATVMYPNWYVIDEFKSNNIPFKSLSGRFDSHDETSWIVHESDFPKIQYLAEGEDCALLLDDQKPFRGSWQVNLSSNRRIWLGWWIETGKKYCLNQSAYTHDPSDDRWYTIEQDKPTYIPSIPKISMGKYDLAAKHQTI